MTRTYTYKIFYWAGDYKNTLHYEFLKDDNGKILRDDNGKPIKDNKKPYYAKERNYIDIEDITVKPNNDIIIKCVGKKPFLFKNGKVMSAGRELDVLNSSFCNQWDVTLPLFNFKEPLNEVEE